ncbi:MAG: NAD(P)-dependent oxidoreductase [Roseburia sp.]|nr:NAD(P)-dependent oxidoreductase [Roseburia sp.]
MKVAIIGANSYIARNFLYLVKQQQADVEWRLYDAADAQGDGEADYKQINLLDKASVAQMDLDCDLIYMFVGKTGSAVGFDQYELFNNINQTTLLNVIDEYRRQQSQAKLVFPSTRLVYKGQEKALKESDEKEYKTIYAINKFACEQYLEAYQRVYGVKYCTLRICIPYGTLIPNASSYGTLEFMLKKATNGEAITLFGDGKQRRTFTYMRDLCEVLWQAGISEECVNDVYNIGGEDYSLDEVAQMVAAKYGVEVLHVEWPKTEQLIESGSTVFDSEKLDGVIGSHYKMSVKEWLSKG